MGQDDQVVATDVPSTYSVAREYTVPVRVIDIARWSNGCMVDAGVERYSSDRSTAAKYPSLYLAGPWGLEGGSDANDEVVHAVHQVDSPTH